MLREFDRRRTFASAAVFEQLLARADESVAHFLDQTLAKEHRERVHGLACPTRPRISPAAVENGERVVVHGDALAVHEILLGSAPRSLDRQELLVLTVLRAPRARGNDGALTPPARIEAWAECGIPDRGHVSEDQGFPCCGRG